MTEYVSISWLLRLANWLFSPFIDFYFSRPKLYIYLDNVKLRTIAPKIPQVLDELTWTGEIVIKNNSKHDAYNLKTDYPKGAVFNRVANLPPYNNLSAKQELRLEFSWSRDYVHNPIGLQFRQRHIDTKYPLDRKEFVLTLEYTNEKGKKFYTVLTKGNIGVRTDLFILKPKIK